MTDDRTVFAGQSTRTDLYLEDLLLSSEKASRCRKKRQASSARTRRLSSAPAENHDEFVERVYDATGFVCDL